MEDLEVSNSRANIRIQQVYNMFTYLLTFSYLLNVCDVSDGENFMP